MRKIRIEELIADTKIHKLEKQNEFILHLFNDNYSEETVYNYNRDLSFFAEFLIETKIQFSHITKVSITYYKGWLKQRKHVHILDKEKEKQEQIRETQEKRKKNVSQTDTALREGPAKKAKNMYKGGYVKNNNPDVLDAMSINRILVSLRNYLRFLVEFDYDMPLAPDAVQLVRSPKKKPQVPMLEEVISLVEAPSLLEAEEILQLRNRAMLETLLATGMRISELMSLNRNQLNSEGKLFITGKGRKQRFAYLTPRAMQHIKEYLDKREDTYSSLFLPTRGSRLKKADPRISTNYLQMKIAEYRRLLEIIVPISAHSIRHAFATYMVENGANPAAIQVLLGHESLHNNSVCPCK